VTENNYNLTYERLVLSTFLFQPALFSEYSKQLTKEHFYLPGHYFIFMAMVELSVAGKPIDEEFIYQKLKSLGHFEEDVMLGIMSANPIANIKPYIEELNKLKDLRSYMSLSIGIKKAVIERDITQIKKLIISQNDDITADKRLPTMLAIEDISRTAAEFILKDWIPIPKNTVSFITAPGGTGKSWIVLQLAARYCMENLSNRVFLWLSEDPAGLSAYRFDTIMHEVLNATQTFGNRLQISNSPTPTLIIEEKNRKLLVDAIWHELQKIFNQFDLIILDPLIAFFGGDENNNGHARFFMQLFTNYASENNKTIIFIHHSSKGTTGARGASAFIDAVRSVYEIDYIKSKFETNSDGKHKNIDATKEHQRIVRLTKDNYGAGQFLKKNEMIIDVFANKNNKLEKNNNEIISLSNMPGDF
jgi:replicative DNA helicase